MCFCVCRRVCTYNHVLRNLTKFLNAETYNGKLNDHCVEQENMITLNFINPRGLTEINLQTHSHKEQILNSKTVKTDPLMKVDIASSL